MKLDELFVCPICHNELPLDEIRNNGKGSCLFCERVYTCNDGIFDLTPIPPPDNDVLDKWSLWEQLQENALIAYRLAPEASCSIAGRPDVAAWKKFLNLKPGSQVLDIGCGPHGTPEYIMGWNAVEAIGIDPLQPFIQPSGILYVKGIGEYLPFRPSSFDSILFATSLDHAISPFRVLSEAKRCLKPTGRVILWIWQETEVSIPLRSKVRAFIFRQIVGRAVYVVRLVGLMPKSKINNCPKHLWQQLSSSLPVPPGATDPYHFRHDDENELQHWCEQIELETARREMHSINNLFIELKLTTKP